jgi:hypothetical protein
MSDFLSDLVQRSVAATALVRPQLFSVFEPLSPGGGSFFREENLEQEQQRPADLLSPSQSSGNANFEADPGAIAAVSKAAPTLDSAEAAGASRVPARIDLRAKQQKAALPGARPNFTRAVKADRESASDHPSPSPQIPAPVGPSAKRVRAPFGRENRGPADATGKIEPGAAEFRPLFPPQYRTRMPSPTELPGDSTNERLPPLPTRKIVEMALHEPSERREAPQVRPIYAVLPRPPSPRPLDLMPPEKNPPPAPIINVTIGRVEVRATRPPPARPAAAPAPAPIMSLDEYLRQRAGGDRR